jgi:hypothetical protein
LVKSTHHTPQTDVKKQINWSRLNSNLDAFKNIQISKGMQANKLFESPSTTGGNATQISQPGLNMNQPTKFNLKLAPNSESLQLLAKLTAQKLMQNAQKLRLQQSPSTQ